MKNMLITCPQCERDINFTKALQEWFDYTDEKRLSTEMCLSIWCDQCQDMTLMMSIFPTSEDEDIYSPALDATVRIKKPKID